MSASSINREYELRMSKYFEYPTNLLQRVYEQQVALESIFTRGLTAYGTIRVNNCSFDKRVFVRFTLDQWRTSSVIKTYYSIHYSNDNTDLFQFKLTVPRDQLLILSSMSISFVIRYCTNEQEFWDNNYSRNYTLEIIESTHKRTASILNQLSTKKSILYDDDLHRQIAQDYHAISNTSQLTGNPCGLKNLGGTCYMNSVIQSLSFTSLLTNYLFSNEYTKDSSLENGSGSKGIVVNEFLNLMYLLCCGKYIVVTPAPFKQIIGHIQYDYLEHQQQDAHEFLIFLLDYLHKDLSRIKSNEILGVNQDIGYNSIIVDLFYGIYQSTTKCVECMYISRTFEPFVCLTLPIPSTNQYTLEDCFTYLNEEEYLTDDSRWFCPQCQRLCNAKKRLEIHKLPKILIIQLKRFQLDFEMNWIKNNTLIIYPEDNLDLHQHCSSSSSSEQSLYTLCSVINHNGSLNDGHYTTFSRDISLDQQPWYEFDDEIINYIQSDKLYTNSNAYLLFYIMKETTESMTMGF